MKLQLVHNNNSSLGFRHYGVREYFAEYFDLVPYDPNKTYNRQDTLVLVHYVEYEQDAWFKPLVEQGFRVVVDHLWDGDVDTLSAVNEQGHLVLRGPNWLWYHSAMLWHHHGHNEYQREACPTFRFFMPMNRQEWHRDRIVEALKPVLDNAIWSYRPIGKNLPGDTEEGTDGVPWRAYYNPAWYNLTRFTVVAESFMRTSNWASAPHGLNYRTEISEKTFKPIAFSHPFLVYGSEGTLRYLKSQGFVTYGELFDESYDDILDDELRFDRVTNSILLACDLLQQGNFVIDSYTVDKLEHNRNHFYNMDRVHTGLYNEIVETVMEYAG